jgi:hypothetical protein
MKSDTVKTLAGLGVITLIVVATFFYGNSQRQAQLKKSTAVTASPGASAKPTATMTPSASPKSSSSAKPSATPASTPVIQDGAVNSAATAMPATGPEEALLPVLAIASISVAFVAYRNSRRGVLAAQRISR